MLHSVVVGLRLTAFLSLAAPLSSWAITHFVDLNSPSPTPPFTDWIIAATNIQDAIDVAGPGDQILVTNGIYQTGGGTVPAVSGTNRVSVTQSVTVQSVNGPSVTSIVGYQEPGTTNGATSVRCVYLTNGAALVGFTLTNGATSGGGNNGGGVWFRSLVPATSVVSNCVFVGNAAGFDAGGAYGGGAGAGPRMALTLIHCTLQGNWSRYGGGANGCVLVGCVEEGNSALSGGGSYQCWLTNCLLVGNSAAASGGGSYADQLVNCTIVSNSVPGTNFTQTGGGVENPALVANCIVYYNTAPMGPNYSDASMFYSCTTPLPTLGSNNITNEPNFLALATGDYHLQSNSPCINSGNNSYVKKTTDFDGNSRITGGTVDQGAFEVQSPASLLSYAWAQQYGLPTDGTADFIDSDSDGMNNWQEWQAGTDPTNPLSVLKLFAPSNSPPGLKISWESVSGKRYYLLRGTNLAVQPALTARQSNIVGQAGATVFTDPTATNSGPYFYRIGVQ